MHLAQKIAIALESIAHDEGERIEVISKSRGDYLELLAGAIANRLMQQGLFCWCGQEYHAYVH